MVTCISVALNLTKQFQDRKMGPTGENGPEAWPLVLWGFLFILGRSSSCHSLSRVTISWNLDFCGEEDMKHCPKHTKKMDILVFLLISEPREFHSVIKKKEGKKRTSQVKAFFLCPLAATSTNGKTNSLMIKFIKSDLGGDGGGEGSLKIFFLYKKRYLNK